MNRQRTSRRVALALGILGFAGPPANADQPLPAAQRATAVQDQILQTLRANPITAPYQFEVRQAGKQFALSGRVGSRQVHDVAVRALIAQNIPFRDDLVIDTRVAPQPAYGPVVGYNYLYPPPLFGRVDDPFLGFEPPLLSYPPYWGAIANRPNIKLPSIDTAGPGPATVQLSVDSQGVAYLSGQVGTQAEKEEVAAKVSGVRGIGGVVNELQVVGNPPAISDVPPPPPTPAFPGVQGRQMPAVVPAPAPGAVLNPNVSNDRVIALNNDPLAAKVTDALNRKPALASLPVKVSAKEGVVTLSGKLPSAYEAMLVFRAAEQTPGVHEVVDRLEFTMPDEDDRNPLRLKGRPEDVEAYLTAQVRRQLGDLAHVDRVRLRGDTVEIACSVVAAEDSARVEATLRSIPLLRGFKLEPTFHTE